LDGYESMIERHVVPVVGTIPLARLSAADVERVTAAVLDKGLSPQTARNVRNVIRRALGDAARLGMIGRNVAADAEPPRVPHREIEALSPAQVRRLAVATIDQPDGPLYVLAVYTGLRQGELLGLTWDDLDGSRLTVTRALVRSVAGAPTLGETKTARSRRTIHLAPAAVEALAEQRRRQDLARDAAGDDWQDLDGFIFTDALGRPLRHDGVSARFRTAADALGFGVRFHDLRHSYASAALAAGVPMHVVSRSLGHSSIGTTIDVYGHLDDADRRSAADAIARAFRDEV
jgi:integrase